MPVRKREFLGLLPKLGELTPAQRKFVVEYLHAQSDLDKVVETVNRHVAVAPRCPRCGASEVQKWGQVQGMQRLRCKACRKGFRGLTGTPLAGLRQREAWMAFAQAMADGLSVRKAAEACGIHPSTAFRWRHRWLQCPRDTKDSNFTGIVEADETFFLESQKGSRQWVRGSGEHQGKHQPDRPPRRRGGAATKRGLSGEQIPVLVVRDRHGATTDEILPKVTQEAVTAVLKPLLSADTILCTDGHGAYKKIAKTEGIAHQAVNAKAGTRVKQRVFHIQNVNAYHSRLKGWMLRFRGVSTRHLANYLGWRRLLDHQAASMAPGDVLAAALSVNR